MTINYSDGRVSTVDTLEEAEQVLWREFPHMFMRMQVWSAAAASEGPAVAEILGLSRHEVD
jgi:hypothetical protein